MTRLRHARELYAQLIAPYLGEPEGASQADIDDLQSTIGFELPVAYVEFLRWMGAPPKDRQPHLFSHDRVFVNDVIENGKIIEDLLEYECVRHLAAPNILVWWVHEVYDSFHFALPAVSDNPPCYRYREGERSLRQPLAFDACLAFFIEAYADSVATLYRKR